MFTLAISAGGQSSRMGTDKAFAEIDGVPLIERVIARTRDLGQAETVLITNRPDEYAHLGLPMYTDVMPDKGALGGVYTAVSVSSAPYTLVVACDMPFLSAGLLRHMVSLLDDDPPPDVVVPRVMGYPQGLHAIYGKGCLDPIRRRLDANRLKVIGFYDEVRVRYLDEPEYQRHGAHLFFNVNTPQQLEEARRLSREG